MARPAAKGERRARCRRNPARYDGLRGLLGELSFPPADWQQGAGSHLLRALNSQPDETPGDVSYTTVRSLTDETVQPQSGRHPTSALDGASNIVIQNVCPGRTTTHIGTAVDSVTFAAFTDAIAHKGKGKRGAARVSRFPLDVCSHPDAPGLNEAQTTLFLNGSGGLIGAQTAQVPKVPAEPAVRKVFKKIPHKRR